jgi:drug/metabolite transporter (DMT)-like permease
MATPGRSSRGEGWAILALLLSTLAFSFSNNLAQVAYDQGLTASTVLVARTLAMLLVIGVWAAAVRLPLAYDLLTCAKMWFLGAALGLINVAFLLGLQLMSVSLMVLLLYLGPILTGLLAAAVGHERLTPLRVAAAVVAFGGLALALNIWGSDVSLPGILYGLATAVGFAINVVGSARMMQRLPSLAVIFHMMVASLVLAILVVLLRGDLAMPAGSGAWWALAAVCITFGIAITTFYVGIGRVGGPRGALIMNNEPVMTIFIAVLILGEVLAPLQYVGAALVIAAVFIVSQEKPPPRPAD